MDFKAFHICVRPISKSENLRKTELSFTKFKHNVVYYTLSIHQNTSMRDETKINNMSGIRKKKYIYILLDHSIPPLCTEFQIIRN
jgi:hypothetical protein